jgi:hypothetical protein
VSGEPIQRLPGSKCEECRGLSSDKNPVIVVRAGHDYRLFCVSCVERELQTATGRWGEELQVCLASVRKRMADRARGVLK